MFDKIAVIMNEAHEDNKSANEISKLNRTISETSQADIKARDRVDISLEEYRKITEENKRLDMTVTRLMMALENLGIPVEVARRIVPGTIDVSVCHDVREFKDRFRIEFDVERWPDI